MRKWLILIALLAFQSFVYAQVDISQGSTKPSFGNRIYFGGNFSLQFGYVTYIDVSPLVGYMINQNFSAGVGVTYRYLKYKDINYETNIYGGRIFVRHNLPFMPIPLFVYSECEDLNLDLAVYNNPLQPDYYTISRQWVPSLFVGGGLFQPIGKKAGFTIMALYNIIYDDQRSPYNSPVVLRVGFTL